jgi:hypothetical protein
MKKLAATPPQPPTSPQTGKDSVLEIAEFFDRLDRGGRTIKIRTHEGTRTKRLRRARHTSIFNKE